MKKQNHDHFIYFLIDKMKIVYVGCSLNPNQRRKEHNNKRHNSIRIIGPFERAHAYKSEIRLIKRIRPKYNKAGLMEDKDPKTIIPFRLRKSLIDKIQKLADSSDRSLSYMLEKAIENKYL